MPLDAQLPSVLLLAFLPTKEPPVDPITAFVICFVALLVGSLANTWLKSRGK